MDMLEESYKVEFNKAMEKYGDMVYRITLTVIGNREDAKDAFQETFLKLVRYQHKITCEEHLKAWLIRTATHCARTVAASPWNKRTQGMETEISSNEDIACRDNPLLEELHKLPEKYAVVLYLHYYEEYSVKEIANAIKRNENTVKTLLQRGRKLLKEKLKEGGFIYE